MSPRLAAALAACLTACTTACVQAPPAIKVDVPPPPVEAPAPAPLPKPEPPPEPEPPPLPVARPAEPAPPDESKQVTELVAYAQRFATLSPDEQRRDYNSATQSLARDRTLGHRIRLALVLSMPGSAVQDDARAVTLLDGAPAAPGALRQFATFLQAQLAERQRAAKRADLLKEQLDALRAVERSIIERGGTAAPRKP